MGWLYGVLAALVLSVAGLGWQLKGAWERETLAEARARQAEQAVVEQAEQNRLVLDRLDALDVGMQALAEGTQENAQQLGQTLAAIDDITKTEGDTDESIACLDVRVPRQLDDSLR